MYVLTHDLHPHSFEMQLTQVKDRLEMAKASSIRNSYHPNTNANAQSNNTGGSNPFSFGGAGSRIAKPLRGGGGDGGGGGGGGGPGLRVLSSLQGGDSPGGSGSGGGGKRGSWFFGRRTED